MIVVSFLTQDDENDVSYAQPKRSTFTAPAALLNDIAKVIIQFKLYNY